MSEYTLQAKAFSILNESLAPYIESKLSEEYGADWNQNNRIAENTGIATILQEIVSWISEKPLQLMLRLWNTVFSKDLALSQLSHLQQLINLQHQVILNRNELNSAFDLMITLLFDIKAFRHATMIQQLRSQFNPKNSLPAVVAGGILKSAEGVAILGGVMAAGYFLYKGVAFLINKIHEGEPIVAESSQTLATEEYYEEEVEVDSNHPFICPITLQIMKDPVVTPQGLCFERQAIMEWLEKSQTCPITHQPLSFHQLITCYSLKNAIEEYDKIRSEQGEPPELGTSKRAKKRIQLTSIEVLPSISKKVHVWDATKIRQEDRCPRFPENLSILCFLDPQILFLIDALGIFV
jgi:hypothetical protein